jgi:hypothetical protein
MQALRASASYSLILSMNQFLLVNPDFDTAVTEELDQEDDDA